jgi:hypothetical protein
MIQKMFYFKTEKRLFICLLNNQRGGLLIINPVNQQAGKGTEKNN